MLAVVVLLTSKEEHPLHLDHIIRLIAAGTGLCLLVLITSTILCLQRLSFSSQRKDIMKSMPILFNIWTNCCQYWSVLVSFNY